MNYKQLLERINHYQEYPAYAIPFAHTKINNLLNGVEKGKYTAVSGRSNSGKTSFVDFYYVISLFKTYMDTEPSKRRPLHIIYFELKDSEEKKRMKWAASYMMLNNKILTDVNTLRNVTGKSFTFDIKVEDTMMQNQEFFNELASHMTFSSQPSTASDIYFKVKEYMTSVGSYHDNIFKYDKEHEGQITLVIINNTVRMRPELDNYNNKLNQDAMDHKLNDYLRELIDKFQISPVVVYPTPGTHLIAKGVPSIKDLGMFGQHVDQGVVMYTPFNYSNFNYHGYEIREFNINNKNRFKAAAIMRNTAGIDNATIPLIFLGEAGYFSNCPLAAEAEALMAVLETLRSIT